MVDVIGDGDVLVRRVIADAALPEPKPATGMPNRSQTCAIGPEPTMSGYTTGSVPYAERQAATAARAVIESAGQRDGGSPWLGAISTSAKPRRSRCLRRRRTTFSGVRSGTRRKSIFAVATAGRTVFEPGPVYPDTMPQIVHVGSKQCFLLSSTPVTPRS